jgi:hypothetical protein
MSARPLFNRARNLPRARAERPRHATERMNKGESLYAAHLEAQRVAGRLSGWWYELLTIRMADNTHYRPDFLVMRDDGSLELHEVKGRKNGKDGKPDTFWAEEDAWLKCKLVAEHCPIPLSVVWPRRDGGWEIVPV